MLELRDVINHKNLTDIYKLLQPNTREYTFFCELSGTFSKIIKNQILIDIKKRNWNSSQHSNRPPQIKMILTTGRKEKLQSHEKWTNLSGTKKKKSVKTEIRK